ncbi:MAG: phosphotransferase [Halieaceae bacterium]|nr:phosphotransferase [Halieaceae bacterium]
MDARQDELRSWACEALAAEADRIRWESVSGEASARRYFRLWNGERSVICADAPPATEKNAEFVAVQSLLANAGLPVPELLAQDLPRGFLLLEDLGSRHLEDALDVAHPPEDYLGAMALLLRLQGVDISTARLPTYDDALLGEEFGRCREWFCENYLGMELPPEEAGVISGLGEQLVACALQQPQVLVYRDYMCRNLLVKPDGGLGLIDFQDAVVGPLCYDLASLLKDCYLRWPPEQVRKWALGYRRELLAAGRPAADSDEDFLRWFDWIGLHRHIKVLGNFTRLALRDDKPGYLKDIPLVLQYIREVLPRYSEFSDFANWWQQRVEPVVAGVSWGARQ